MKYVDEFRGTDLAQGLVDRIRRAATRPLTLMEVCGGQTHTILKYGIQALLPETIELLHGPGCPVCVTPVALIDHAVALAREPGVCLTSFGDMLRVPGSATDLLHVKARGGDVRMVYSPLDALRLATEDPKRQVVFFAVGFETTAPSIAAVIERAAALGLGNISFLTAHVLVPPALGAVLDAADNRVQAFLAPGHVCTVMGYRQYEALASRYRVPIVVTGFEPVDLLQGIANGVDLFNAGRGVVDNQYSRSVSRDGNVAAQRAVDRVFEVCDREWRGIGMIPMSGLALRPAYHAFDAGRRFALPPGVTETKNDCIAGEVLRGVRKPHDCAAFGARCTPERPQGAPMVSAEGVCAAYFQYRRTA
ncbi:MAG: hydrogenase formation protein HypD [Deltaproteobacteria bacterium]|nr:hydrogenase formation protein HypD [Deltaproteobacteria bacterium]